MARRVKIHFGINSSVQFFTFQCSEHTTAGGILEAAQRAIEYFKQNPNSRPVLVLDELGLAEASPSMPLKFYTACLMM